MEGWTITTTVSGPVLVALIGLIGIVVTAYVKLVELNRNTKRVAARVEPIGNGFTKETKDSLKDIRNDINALQAAMNRHLEFHAQHPSTERRTR